MQWVDFAAELEVWPLERLTNYQIMQLTYVDGITIRTTWEEFVKSNPGSPKFLAEVKEALFTTGIYHGRGKGNETFTLISPRKTSSGTGSFTRSYRPK
jgi:hypothetical protein